MQRPPALQLPEALQPWAPWLAWFSAPLGEALGDLLRRLHPFLGQVRQPRQAGLAEPEGVDDLRRRGSYERLLSSEWLLATELPEEFLRRAASGEHLFLSPRPRTGQAARLTLALFDAGPLQWGAPRLAQVALWIVLARRAAQTGSRLRWGTLQAPGQWFEADSADQLQALLAARSFETAGEAHAQAWRQWLAGQPEPVGEAWLIGGEALQPWPLAELAAPHLFTLQRDVADETLALQLRGPGGTRRLSLPLPPPFPASRLLKGNFAAQAAQAGDAPARRPTVVMSDRLSLKLAPVISPDGSFVAAVLLDGHGASVLKVRHREDGRGLKAKPQRWSAQAEALGLAFMGRGLGALLSQPPQLRFWQLPVPMSFDRPAPSVLDAPPGRAVLLPCAWVREGGGARLYVLDGSRRLVAWQVRPPAPGLDRRVAPDPEQVQREVLALIPWMDSTGVVYAHLADPHTLRLQVFSGQRGVRHHRDLLLPPEATVHAVWVAGSHAWFKGFGSVAWLGSRPGQPQVWRVHHPQSLASAELKSWQTELPAGARAVGLVHRPATGEGLLVVLAANRQELLRVGEQGTSVLFRAPDPIERVTVCPTSGVIALLTRERELHICSALDKTLHMRLKPGEGAT